MDIERGPLVPEREDKSGEAVFSVIEDGKEVFYGVRVGLPPILKRTVDLEPVITEDIIEAEGSE